MFSFLKKRVTLLGFLALACAVALHYQTKADSLHQTIFPKDSIFYTPGQHSNCQWVVHISDRISTQSGNTSPVQIGIPEVIKDGYIAGILQSGPGNSLLFAFKLPLKNVRFRVFNSTVLTMVLYSTFEDCIEAIMK